MGGWRVAWVEARLWMLGGLMAPIVVRASKILFILVKTVIIERRGGLRFRWRVIGGTFRRSFGLGLGF
jgi:hypothetical protein